MNKTTEALKRIREVLSEPDDEETIAKIREALAEQTLADSIRPRGKSYVAAECAAAIRGLK